ncbi:MAG: YqgE/AlgH family protein [Rhizobiaceae bacterium]|nr:YqgE/AlgH family protein [Rhizobiaceae bacterium]
MDKLHESLLGDEERGCFDGQFLLAMPGLSDSNFSRTVIFICAHNSSGAVGFVLNRDQPSSFAELMIQLELLKPEDAGELPNSVAAMSVQTGGPVDAGRGFVLHSNDYKSDATLPVTEKLSMTATVDILRAIVAGKGPARATLMLGYSGWGAGQLESEVTANGWLTCPAVEDIIFDPVLDDKYDRAFASMGIDPAMLSSQCGEA